MSELRRSLEVRAERGVARGAENIWIATVYRPAPSAPSAPKRHRLLLVAVAAVLAGGVGWWTARGGGDTIAGTASQGGDSGEAWQRFVLPGETVLSESPLVVTPAPGLEASFDTTDLGRRLVFEPITVIDAELAALWTSLTGQFGESALVKVTLLGEVDGEPWFVSVTDGPNIEGADRDTTMRSRFVGSSQGASGSGDVISADSLEMIESLPHDLQPVASGVGYSAPTGWVQWDPLPSDTAVATFADSDQRLWITPRGGVAVFPAQFDDGERFTLQAFTADGELIGTVTETAQYGADAQTTNPQPGDDLGTLRGTDAAGGVVTIAPGDHATLFVYGANWCVPCAEAASTVLPALQDVGDAVDIHTITHYSDDTDTWPKDEDWPYPQFVPEPNSPLLSIGTIPTVLAVDANNHILGIIEGFDSLTAELQQLGIQPR